MSHCPICNQSLLPSATGCGHAIGVPPKPLPPCFVCGKDIKPLDGAPQQGDNAAACSLMGNFGSQVYDALRESEYRHFIVCDECLAPRMARTRGIVTNTTVEYVNDWPTVGGES